MPSASGCRSPNGPTRFGPMRSCIHAETFRSRRIKYAQIVRMAPENHGDDQDCEEQVHERQNPC